MAKEVKRVLQEDKRDLTAELAICCAATPGPWVVDGNLANQVRELNRSKRRKITTPPDADGLNDAVIISKARIGWPTSIERAMTAETKAKSYAEENEILRAAIMTTYKTAHNDVARREGCQCYGTVTFADYPFAKRLVRNLQPILFPEVEV